MTSSRLNPKNLKMFTDMNRSDTLIRQLCPRAYERVRVGGCTLARNVDYGLVQQAATLPAAKPGEAAAEVAVERVGDDLVDLRGHALVGAHLYHDVQQLLLVLGGGEHSCFWRPTQQRPDSELQGP